MLRALRLTFGILLIAAACSRESSSNEWNRIEALEGAIPAAGTSGQRLAARQAWVDALKRFVERNPSHREAAKAYGAAVLAHAQDLSGRGMYEEALPYYRTAASFSAPSSAVREQWARAVGFRRVSRDELAKVIAGQEPAAVVDLVGRPRPGWMRPGERPGEQTWYYPSEDGGVAAIYFVNGVVASTAYPPPGHPMK